MRALIYALVAIASLALTGCEEDSPARASAGPLQLDEYCDLPDLARPLRQTILVIDQTAVVPAAREDMLSSNRALFDLVRGLADPERSFVSGALAPRERLSVYAADAESGDLRLLVSGCPPTFTAEELAALRDRRGGIGNNLDDFFGSDPRRHAQERGEEFRNAVIARVNDLGQAERSADRRGGGTFEDSILLRAFGGLPNLSDEDGLVRLFVFTDLNRLTPQAGNIPDARSAGFDLARQAQVRLRLAEVHLVGSGAGTARFAEPFADAFILGSQGRLVGWGAPAFNALPPPPETVRFFAGQIDYPPVRFPVTMRLAADRRGVLIDSWITVTSNEESSTPITGGLTCDAQDVCRVTTDDAGLAQAWSLSPGGEAEFDGNMPLGGLRVLRAEIRGGRMTGAVTDPTVIINGAPDGLTFELTEQVD